MTGMFNWRRVYSMKALCACVACVLVSFLVVKWKSSSVASEKSSLHDTTSKASSSQSTSSKSSSYGGSIARDRPNLVFILTDQQRFDAIGRVQEELNVPKKSRIRTPNLDRLSWEGAYFRNCYTHCPVCVPARASLLTGRTIEHTGVRSNFEKTNEDILKTDAGTKLPRLRTYDEILVQDQGYVAEYYGKWHTAELKGYVYSNDVTQNNVGTAWFGKYEADNRTKHYANGLQTDYRKWLGKKQVTQNECRNKLTHPLSMGESCLPDGFSLTSKQSEDAIIALRRLGKAHTPFSLHLSINAPHPPFQPTPKYYNMYDPADMIVPAISLNDTMENSGYKSRRRDGVISALREHTTTQRLMATYYGFVTEIDESVGVILDTIDELGIANNTLVIFSSDHGEMLGTHAMMGKYVLYEGSAHVPLLMRFPGMIDPGIIVDAPVSHLDLHGTILDYLQTPVDEKDQSDGSSLRKFVERTDKQEAYAVTEWSVGKDVDQRTPGYGQQRDIHEPEFMIRHGNWKLLMPGFETGGLDMLFNLHDDPLEMENLVGNNGLTASDDVIGKAEHLKSLLLQYLMRTRHPDEEKIRMRQTWRVMPFWIGDSVVKFRPLLSDGTRTEWLHFGSATESSVPVKDVSLEGPDAERYKVEWQASALRGHRVLAITYSQDPGESRDCTRPNVASLVVRHTAKGKEEVATVQLMSPERKECSP